MYNFRGTISLVSADNLALWALGGYKALGSALRKCQYCMATGKDMQQKVCDTCIYIHCFYIIFVMIMEFVLF